LSTHRRVVRQWRASSRSTFPQAPLLIQRGGRVPQEADREAHVPTQQAEASEAARVPPAHADAGRPSDREIAAPQGPLPVVGLIGRISDRATFEALRRAGRRARRGPVTVVYAPGPTDVRVAYSVGKRLGPAVQRNRVRRRLRAALRELDTDSGGLPPGAYLVMASPSAVQASYAELKRSIAVACDAAARDAGR
jgi:ribonuclease P protein component